MAPLLTAMPDSFAAGSTLDYTRSYPEYVPSAGWAIRLYLAGPTALNVVGTGDGSGNWNFVIDSVTSGAIVAGTYRWVERASNAGRVLDLSSGLVAVTLDLAAATAGQAQSWEEKTLAIVELAIAGQLDKAIESYQIAGRSVAKIPIAELTKIRGQLVAAVNRQRRGGQLGRQHLLEFRKPR